MESVFMHAADLTALQVMHRRAVLIMAFIAVLATLKIAAPILMPVGVAIFLVALAWPINTLLSRFLPQTVSYVGAFIALLLVIAIFCASLWFSAQEILNASPHYKETLLQLWSNTKRQLTRSGVDATGAVTLSDIRLMAGLAAQNFHEMLIYFIVIITYVILALPEMATWKSKLRVCLGKEHCDKILSTTNQMGKSFQHYLLAMLIAGVISAVGTWIAAYAIGLDFAFSWGVLAFLMNFIPILGAMLMILPPTIFAFLQFGDMNMVLIVFASFAFIQMFVGGYVDPKLQGSMLSLSPLVVLFSLALWGFLWGLPGVLLAAPLTHAIIIACNHYERTRWIACLCSDRPRAFELTPN